MFNENLELAEEFPNYKDAIHRLKTSNTHFARLYAEYHTVTRQLDRIAQEIEAVSDDVAEIFKKKRLALKDELFRLLKTVA